MDRYLIKKLKDAECVSFEDSKYVVFDNKVIDRLRTLKIYLDTWDLPNVFKILTGEY